MKLTKEHFEMAKKLEVVPAIAESDMTLTLIELVNWGIAFYDWHKSKRIWLTAAGRYVLESESKKLLDVTV